MVRLIMGEKGTGKTKKLIEMINTTAPVSYTHLTLPTTSRV